MIIGVDAGTLGINDERLKVGVWRVAVNLLRQLGKLDQKNTYRLYSFAPIESALLASFGPRMKNVVLRPTPGWFTLRLPLELQLNPVDIFLGLAQALPRGPSKKIGFVYDTGFLNHPEAYLNSAKRLRKQTEEVIKRADRLVTISKSTKQAVLKHYHFDKKKIIVAYPGVDNRFSTTGKSFVGKNPYFLFVGALKPGKNIPFLIRAFAKFLKQSKKVYDLLLIGGDYWLDPEIKKTIKSLKLSGRVKSLGFVSDEVLPTYYRGAEALIAPSLVEGFCLPTIEAMASGCPVIVSNLPVMREIVGEAGIFVNPAREASLVEALVQVSGETALRKQLVIHGLMKIKRYSWSQMARIVFKLYEA